MKVRFAIPLAVLALTLGTSACGSDSGESAGAESTPTTLEQVEKELESQGHEVVENEGGGGTIKGNGDGGGGGTLPGSGGGGAQMNDKQVKTMQKVVECMRAKGYDMPDASPTSRVVAPKNVEGMDPAKVNKDSQECAQQAQAG